MSGPRRDEMSSIGKVYNVGDILGDCSKCGEQASIKYDGGDKAHCEKCGVICEVQFDEDERIVDGCVDESVPNYIRKSRPWRWVHELKRTGNPYTPDTKSWRVFDHLVGNSGPDNDPHRKGLPLPELVAVVSMDTRVNTDGVSYLITIHEVVTQCRYAGLLCVEEDVVSVVSK
jgi:hypothetical protein